MYVDVFFHTNMILRDRSYEATAAPAVIQAISVLGVEDLVEAVVKSVPGMLQTITTTYSLV